MTEPRPYGALPSDIDGEIAIAKTLPEKRREKVLPLLEAVCDGRMTAEEMAEERIRQFFEEE